MNNDDLIFSDAPSDPPIPAARRRNMASPKIEKLVNQLSIELPRRDLREFRKYGTMVIGFGAFAMLFMCIWVSGPLWMAISMLRGGDLIFGTILLLFAASGLVGMRFAYGAIAIGVGITRNETWAEIHWNNGKLYVVERLWRFKWTRRCKLKTIGKLVFVDGGKLQGADEMIENGECFKNLQAKPDDGEDQFVVAFWYDVQTLKIVARELAEQIESAVSVENFVSFSESGSQASRIIDRSKEAKKTSGSGKIEIEDRSNEEVEEPLSLKQPEDSKIELEEFDHATVLNVPPAGVFRGSRGLMLFAIVWCSFCAFMTIAMLVSVATGSFDGSPWMLLILIPFWAVGIGIGLASYNMGIRKLTIGATADAIWIERESLFGKKVVELTAAEILEIKVGPSGVEVNDDPLMEAQIYKADGSKFSMGSQLTTQENRWIVATLKTRLSQDGLAHQKDWPVIQKLSTKNRDGIHHRIKLSETNHSKLLSVPRDQFVRLIPAFVFMGGFAAIGLGLAFFTGDAIAVLIGILFASFPILILPFVVVFAFRRFEIQFDSSELVVTRIGLFGTRKFVFIRDKALVVDIGNNMVHKNSVNQSQPVLSISDKSQRHKFMYQRSKREILYVAATLNIWLKDG